MSIIDYISRQVRVALWILVTMGIIDWSIIHFHSQVCNQGLTVFH